MPKTLHSHTDGMVVVKLRSPSVTLKAALASPATRRALVAEFLGSLLFMVFGAGTVVVTGAVLGEKLTSARLLAMALAQGMAFCLLVLATARLSGGHLNPAVTFAAMLTRQMTLGKAILYMVSQCAGAVVGALALMLIVPAAAQGGLGAHALAGRVTIAGGLVAEAVLSFLLVSAVLAAVRGGMRPGSAGLAAVGLSATVAYMFGTPLTGASMNPARSFGSALVAGIWSDHWIFWIGPLAGGGLAALAHRFLDFGQDRS